VVALFVLVCGWVRVRDRIAAWWRYHSEVSFFAKEEQARA
jgi:hypothetical protein